MFRKKFSPLAFTMSLLLLASTSFAVTVEQLHTSIEGILNRSSVSNNTWSILITNRYGTQTYYAKDPDVPRKPASNTKLYTTAAAYEMLGYNHYWNGDQLITSIRPINKNSNNTLADSLLTHIGSELSGSATYSAGAQDVLQWCSSIGIDMTGAQMYDGSGLSHYNRFTARQTIGLLNHMVNNYTGWDNSLAIGCTDGTIGSRFCGTVGSGRVHAKTGTLTGVIALSGYIRNQYDGEWYLFSFLANNVGNRTATRDAIDDMVVLMGQSQIPNEGANPSGIVVDNRDPGFITSGTWSSSTGVGYYNENSLFATVGGGEDVARWTPTIPQTGRYQLQAWWVASPNRSTDALYKVHHSEGVTNFTVDQTQNGGLWMTMGSYLFEEGTSGFVTLNDTGNGDVVSADAMRWNYVGPVDYIVDNSDAGFSLSGTWGTSTGSGYYGSNSLFATVGGDADTATWSPTLGDSGLYDVQVWWVASSNRSSDAVYTVNHLGGSTPFTVNQTQNGGQWMSLGEYQFSSGTSGSVTLTDSGSGDVVSADAVRFVLKSIVEGPPAPANLVASSSDSQVTLDWDDVTDVTGYNIYRSTNENGPFSQLNGSLLGNSNYTDNSVVNFTTYYYTVRSVDNESTESGDSNKVSATPSETIPPAVPANLVASSGDGTVDLDWDDNLEADLGGYNVYRATTSGGPYTQLNGSTVQSSEFTDNAVINSSTYYYVVSAVDSPAGNESAFSAEVSATPVGTAPPNGEVLVQAEDYDLGGEGVGYSDSTSGNSGGAYRTDDVDIEPASVGGYNVGYITSGEWLKYSNVSGNGGSYSVQLSVASLSAEGAFFLEVNGVDATGLFTFPATGGFQTWATVDVGNVALNNGANTVRLVSVADNWNVDWIKFSPASQQPGIIDFDSIAISSYGTQDVDVSSYNVLDNGSILTIYDNSWKKVQVNASINALTVLRFDYKSDAATPEIGGIGFDTDESLSPDFSWRLWGSQDWGINTFANYSFGGNGWVRYTIPVGEVLSSGTYDYLVFINDNDGGSGAYSWFRNVKIYDRIQYVVDNDSGSPEYSETGGWSTSGSAGYNGGTYRFAAAGDPNTATWSLNAPENGSYTVSVAYVSGSNRASNTVYTIQTASGPVSVSIDQTTPNLQWVDLGTFDFDAGSGSVTLDASASSGGTVVISDVVRVSN